jgi:hypothetical protein
MRVREGACGRRDRADLPGAVNTLSDQIVAHTQRAERRPRADPHHVQSEVAESLASAPERDAAAEQKAIEAAHEWFKTEARPALCQQPHSRLTALEQHRALLARADTPARPERVAALQAEHKRRLAQARSSAGCAAARLRFLATRPNRQKKNSMAKHGADAFELVLLDRLAAAVLQADRGEMLGSLATYGYGAYQVRRRGDCSVLWHSVQHSRSDMRLVRQRIECTCWAPTFR